MIDDRGGVSDDHVNRVTGPAELGVRGQLFPAQAPRWFVGGLARCGRYRVTGGEGISGGIINAAVLELGDDSLPVEDAQHGGRGVTQFDAVLWAAGTCDGGHYLSQVQFEDLAVIRRVVRVVPHALFLGIGLDQVDLVLRPAGQPHVVQRLLIDGEDRTGSTVFGAHVAQGRAVGQGDVPDTGTEELDKFAHHPGLAEQLRNCEHEVGRCGSLRQLTGQFQSDHLGDQHAHRLAEHGGLRLDTTDSPTENTEAVDHRGVGVGTHQRVRVGLDNAVVPVPREDHPGEVFQVDLVADAGVRWDHHEVVEGLLRPSQQLVALVIALELQLGVLPGCIRGAEHIGDDRVVDHEFTGDQGVDPLRVTAQFGHRIAHGHQVNDAGHTGEVLHEHPGRGVLDFDVTDVLGIPGLQRLNLRGGDNAAILVAQQVLQQHLQAVREPGGSGNTVQSVDFIGLVPHLEGIAGIETV